VVDAGWRTGRGRRVMSCCVVMWLGRGTPVAVKLFFATTAAATTATTPSSPGIRGEGQVPSSVCSRHRGSSMAVHPQPPAGPSAETPTATGPASWAENSPLRTPRMGPDASSSYGSEDKEKKGGWPEAGAVSLARARVDASLMGRGYSSAQLAREIQCVHTVT
jgi:hypothetical protein